MERLDARIEAISFDQTRGIADSRMLWIIVETVDEVRSVRVHIRDDTDRIEARRDHHQ